jgi:hypothetical protein
MSTSVFALATSDAHADAMVKALIKAGFSLDDISLLMPDVTQARDLADKKDPTVLGTALAGGATGGIIGGALGWVARIGLLAIPGFGPMIAAGPIMAALSGAAIGGTLGSITGSLISLGMHDSEAKRYEGQVRSGRILISVHTSTRDKVASARKNFSDQGALDIGFSTEVSTKVAIPLSASALKAKMAETRLDPPAS